MSQYFWIFSLFFALLTAVDFSVYKSNLYQDETDKRRHNNHLLSFTFRILHQNGFSEDEMLHRKAAIYSNTIQSMAAILSGMKLLNVMLEKSEHEVCFIS
jgi:hypothetical protein